MRRMLFLNRTTRYTLLPFLVIWLFRMALIKGWTGILCAFKKLKNKINKFLLLNELLTRAWLTNHQQESEKWLLVVDNLNERRRKFWRIEFKVFCFFACPCFARCNFEYSEMQKWKDNLDGQRFRASPSRSNVCVGRICTHNRRLKGFFVDCTTSFQLCQLLSSSVVERFWINRRKKFFLRCELRVHGYASSYTFYWKEKVNNQKKFHPMCCSFFGHYGRMLTSEPLQGR